MKITLITVGKIKERYFEDAIKEYSKRLSRYCKLEIIQVADEKTPDGAGEALEAQIREKEGRRILAQVKDGAYVIALAIEGKMLDSVELSETIARLGVEGKSQVAFVIGGSFRFVPGGHGPGRLRPELFPHDVPASADAGHFAGTNLQGISDCGGGAVS